MKKEKPAPRVHRVYVIRLRNEVWEKSARHRKANPGHRAGAPHVYVGSTALSAEERFRKHLEGVRAAPIDKRFGKRLMPKEYEHLPTFAERRDAERLERKVAMELRARGWAVSFNADPLRPRAGKSGSSAARQPWLCLSHGDIILSQEPSLVYSADAGASLMRVALVSCVKSKRSSPAPAGDLYTSALFQSLRTYAERNADRWFILSAEHGLLDPNHVIAPYEKTLNRMGKADREAWASRVQRQLGEVLPAGAEVVMLAGERYREGLVPFLKRRGHQVTIPLQGLPFGRQLQRLGELNRAPR